MAIRKDGGGQQQDKSSVWGASANLINAIVGAGIVGIPYAIQQSGFLTGVVLVVVVACLAEKSLRMLVETASHVHVTSYEALFQVAFGQTWGFVFLSSCMALLAYGSMVTYLIIVKDVFPSLLCNGEMQNLEKQMILIAISSCIMVPISCQRDMAQLSKTSRINVLCDLIMVSLVVYKSPFISSVSEEIGQEEDTFLATQQQDTTTGNTLENILLSISSYTSKLNTATTTSPGAWTIRPDTVFVGLGVLSFAFVCQHSAFIIAGSLPRVRQQWPRVTKIGLFACGSLAVLNGIAGFVTYGDDTQGNILNNLGSDTIAKVAKGMLGTTMIFVYPLESFVARHALVALLFHNYTKTPTSATNNGEVDCERNNDTTAVWEFLNCKWKRVCLTIGLYVLALIPALLYDDLGKVLAVVGTIGGSCLSYIAPGASYLAIHGQQFLELVGCGPIAKEEAEHHVAISEGNEDNNDHHCQPSSSAMTHRGRRHYYSASTSNVGATILWYISLMPLWCGIAHIGYINIARHNNRRQHQALNDKETSIELVAIAHHDSCRNENNNSSSVEDLSRPDNDIEPLIGHPNHRTTTSQNTSIMKSGAATAASTIKKDWTQQHRSTLPTVRDFWIAIGYILFGTVALVVGLYCIFAESSTGDVVVR